MIKHHSQVERLYALITWEILAFSASSKKEFKFSKVFWTRLTFHVLFLKSKIFLFRVDVDKKNSKNEKNQIYKKKKEVEGPSLGT